MSFVHLHVHSEYSLLDGFSNIKKLVRRAKELEMPAVALTDHGTMFGVMSFYNEATKAGIKPIIGVEAYMAARSMLDRDPKLDKRSSHLLLLAENQTGYQNLLRLASAAQLDGFYYNPRVDHDLLASHSEGLICTSGCLSAEIPRAIMDGNLEKARQKLDWYYEVFGPDRFFIELQHHDIEALQSVNRGLLELGERYKARFVATNDVHYVDAEDARLQDILLAIQTSCVLSDPKRMRMSGQSYYLRTAEEMRGLFGEVPGALENTLLIAERCELDLGFKGYRLPAFEVPDGKDARSYLRELCEQGLETRYGEAAQDPVIRDRLNYELKIIHEMGFDTYFLIVWDLCKFAQQENIWYNARGSAAGSIVAYTLDITMVDPIEHGLIFERFLNPGRISMPDIDLDFQDDMRHKMLEYCGQRYGEDKVAQIITFGTLKARAAVRDVGRVLDVPLNEVDRLAKHIPNIPGKPVSITEALEQVTDLQKAYSSTEFVQELIDTAKEMEGVVRNAGTHAAGVIITDKPIVEYVPLHRPTGAAAEDSPIKTVTQFGMETLDSLGLLKVDFLGLATLTIMARACKLIEERHGIRFDLTNIPTDDELTYELLGRGETAGVFQVEGSGMRRYLVQMKPQTLDHVVAMVALFRPGPMDFIPTYISRMHGDEEISYSHPTLGPIFEETYGIPVYQEQIMRAAVEIAGYEASEADDLRKAIAKKIKAKLMKHREKFVKGSAGNGIPKEVADQIFTDWEEFARYGFNKSHAVDYGFIAVQTAYLKAHYSVEYMTALLSVTKNDSDKVAYYVADCRRMGIEVLPPDVNSSDWDFVIEDSEDGTVGIRFGMGAVKNVGLGPVECILHARRDGLFKDINDFARRVDLRAVGKRALECLIKVGAFASYAPRVVLLEAMDQIHAISASHFRAKESGQMSLFGARTGLHADIALPKLSYDISRREQLNWEKELIGLYVSDHPLNPYFEDLQEVVTHFSAQLSEAQDREVVRVAGLITQVRPHQTRSGKSMAFVKLEDLQGTIELVVFPRSWASYAELLLYDNVVIVQGKVDGRSSEPKVLVDTVSTEFALVGPASERQPTARPKPDAAGPVKPKQETETSTPILVKQTDSPAKEYAVIDEFLEPGVFDDAVPPDPFPESWEIMEQGLVSAPATGRLAQPSDELDETAEPLKAAAPVDDTRLPPEAIIAETVVSAASALEQTAEVVEKRPEVPVLPEPPGGSADDSFIEPTEDTPPSSDPIQMLTVILRGSGDKTRDILHLRRIYGTLISFPGQDRFAFYMVESGRSYVLEFPNFTTGMCQPLLDRLHSLVGSENVRVEKLTFQ